MKRSLVMMVLISVTFFMSACSNTRWHKKVAFENKNLQVSLESKEENGQILTNQYAHPVDLKKKTLEIVLKSISFNEEAWFFSGKKKTSVFQDNEIQNMVPPIVSCLKKADSSQRIHFISYNRGDGGIFSHLRQTEGFVFIKPSGILNIAFSKVNQEIKSRSSGDPVEIEIKVDPLSEKNSQHPVFSENLEIKNHVFENGEKSPLWLVANINKIKEEVKNTKRDEKTKKSIIPSKTDEKEDDSWNQKENMITRQLQYIKGLFSQGLISKEDYEAKKKELLEKIDLN